MLSSNNEKESTDRQVSMSSAADLAATKFQAQNIGNGSGTLSGQRNPQHESDEVDDHYSAVHDNMQEPSSSIFSVLRNFVYNAVWPGLGLLGESYMLFSIGTLRPIWDVLFPDCFVELETCSEGLLHSLSYSVVTGVVVGMIVIGYAANFIGRRAGSITTASLMCTGSWLLTIISFTAGSARFTTDSLFRCFSASLFLFGVGVGGEYPLSASSASEKAMEEMNRRREKKQYSQMNGSSQPEGSTSLGRGQRIQLVFTMQGMGIFINSLIMTALLFITGQRKTSSNDEGNDENDDQYYSLPTLLIIWQITYFIGAFILTTVLVTRISYLTESKVWLEDQTRKQEQALQKLQQLEEIRCQEEQKKQNSSSYLPPAIQMVNTVSSLSLPSVVADAARTPSSDNVNKHNTKNSGDDNIGPVHQGPDGIKEDQIPDQYLSQQDDDELEDPKADLHRSVISLLFEHYGMRLFGSSLAWLLWDVAFYGNKLFQSTFLLALTGSETTLVEFAVAATLNSAVALAGYFAAAAIIDSPQIGRRNLQQWGFLLTGTLFVGVGMCFERLPTALLVTMYLGSSFFGQLGPNATTFLIPAEIFPTEMRTVCHGVSAASGKLGYASFLACFITFLTIPETTGLDLFENDRKWRMILSGRKDEYDGDANLPEYLSFYEYKKKSISSMFEQCSNLLYGNNVNHDVSDAAHFI